jgi:hypothetical protein
MMNANRHEDPFRKQLQTLLNKHSRENESNTPDFILAAYLLDCLEAFDNAVAKRERWYDTGVKTHKDDPNIPRKEIDR